jgi:hypothetical protein
MKYFQTGFDTEIIVENPDVDFSSEETQYTLLEFYDKLQRSYLNSEVWY